MKRISMLLATFACVAMLGCGDETETPDSKGAAPEITPVAAFAICGDCGHQKETTSCCAEGADVCADCGLHAGSPGCCKIEKGQTGVEICACGHIKGDENCCNDTAARCAKCGMFEGSPGCCKIDTSAGTAAASN
mgnify:CR=1 FL=1